MLSPSQSCAILDRAFRSPAAWLIALGLAALPAPAQEFIGVRARFIEVFKHDSANTRLHISEIEAFALGVIPDEADADGTSQNDFVQNGSPATEFPPTTTSIQHGAFASVYDGDLESGADVWSTNPGLGVEPRYMLDLGATHEIDIVRVWNRNDGCCTDRLQNFSVRLYPDDGSGLPGVMAANLLFPGTAQSPGKVEFSFAVPNPGILSFTADKTLTFPDQALTLAWELHTNVTSAVITPGIGDVLPLTTNSLGFLMLNPGPAVNTIYTLTAERPDSTNTSEVAVTVTDQPIVYAFAADKTLVEEGSPIRLTWQVTNTVSLLLNGVDVTGTTSAIRNPTSTTIYTLTATNPNGSTAEQIQVTVVVQGEPVLSEFMADAAGEFPDEDGDDSDWIELWNPGAEPVLLEGYHLTDDPLDPDKWTFPSRTLNPGEYLVIFASGKDRTGAVLHTNFQLDRDGEYLALFQPDALTVRTEFSPAFPDQRRGTSYGFDASLAMEGFMINPTPEAANDTVYAGFVKDTRFSVDRGFYDVPFDLAITSDTPGAEIRYTTDGSPPSENSGTVYTVPVPIDRTTIVRAAAYKAGQAPTDIDTQTYLFRDDIIAHPSMRTSVTQDPVHGPRMRDGLTDIPSISLVYQGDIVRTESACSIEFINFEAGHTQLDAGMVRFGNFVTNFEKRQVRIYFRRSYGAGKLRFPLFRGFDHGLPPVEVFDQLDIRNGSHDMSQRGFYMSARFTDDTMLDMGHLHSHGRFVHVYVNGQYNGQYHLRERWNADMHAKYLGGNKEDYEAIVSNRGGVPWTVGVPYDGDGTAWANMLANINDYDAVRPYLNVPQFIDWLLLWMSGNSEHEHRAVGPVSAGTGFVIQMNDPDGFLRPIGDRTDSAGPHDMFSNLRGHPDFDILVADRIHRNYFNDGPFTPTRNIARLLKRTDEIDRAFLAEAARWGYRTPESWAAARDSYVSNNFPTLTQTMIDRFRNRGLYPSLDAPVLGQHGGEVPADFALSMQSDGTIYYTTDGSDPRLPGGGISPTALTKAGGGGPGGGANSNRTWLARGSSWNYLDDGTDQGAAWSGTNFNDSAWASGVAELGYGDGNEATTVSFGPNGANKYITTYFRHTFSGVPATTNLVGLKILLRRDDGAVVHLNGQEVVRSNIPNGATDYQTTASSSVGGGDESTYLPFNIDQALLREGSNTVAVEVHQFSGTSSDISFDLEMIAEYTAGPPPDPGGTNGPVVIAEDTIIKARAFDGTWSALTEASFFIEGRVPADAGNLVLCEIHYNPDGPDDAEFLEFINPTTNTLDLSGLTISNAIDFTFQGGTGLEPGGILVITRNAGAFESRYQVTNSPYYQPDILVAGQWLPSVGLDNDGDTIVLLASNGTEIVRFRYDDDGRWPGRADGVGSSLELRAPEALPADPALRNAYYANPYNWRPSCAYHGSPGTLDTCTEIVVNELLTHSDVGEDWVEFYNPGTQPADIGGWFISDTYTNLTRYTIPANTSVPGKGYLVLDESQLNFAFSEGGEQAVVSIFADTNLITFVERFDFGPAARDVTFGRYERSDGEIEFPALRFPTRMDANAYPMVGPVVISEIMYHPTNGYEFIELANITGARVPLFDTANPTGTWKFTSAIDFLFPTNTFLEPWGVILLTDTNPAVFRASLALPAEVPVFGPWDGALDNAGESLKLRRPGDRELDGEVSFILTDKVEYEPFTPWPVAADGTGRSLERILLYAYGNDPINWRASAIEGGTPGVVPGGIAHLFIQPDEILVTDGEVRFSAIPGQRYQVEYSEDLRTGAWQVLAILTAGDSDASVFDPESTPRRYYRVLWIP